MIRRHPSLLPRRLTLGVAALAPLLGASPTAVADEARPPTFAFPDATPMSQATAPDSWRASQDMVTIAAGIYPIGRDGAARDQAPAHHVTLRAFAIDRTEVTNAAYADFLNALSIPVLAGFEAGDIRPGDVADADLPLLREGRDREGLYPLIALDDDQARIGGRDGRFAPTPGYADHPAAETTWAGARAYCRWRGARLPTEAEWEAAARGAEGRLYPWGDTPPTAERAFTSGRTAVTATVGTHPAGATPDGLMDMAGSMAEWTNSLKRPYPYNADDGREDPDTPGERVTRGGDYIYDAGRDTLTATHRDGFSNAPERGHRHIGFRCSRPIEG